MIIHEIDELISTHGNLFPTWIAIKNSYSEFHQSTLIAFFLKGWGWGGGRNSNKDSREQQSVLCASYARPLKKSKLPSGQTLLLTKEEQRNKERGDRNK